jgi:chromosome segregation ATPase
LSCRIVISIPFISFLTPHFPVLVTAPVRARAHTAQAVLEKVVADLHDSMKGQAHWNAAWQKATHAMSQRDRALVQVAQEHEKTVDRLTLLSQVEQRLERDNAALAKRCADAEAKIAQQAVALDAAHAQIAASAVSIRALGDRYESAERMAERTNEALIAAEARARALGEQADRSAERMRQSQAEAAQLETQRAAEHAARAAAAVDAKRALAQVESETQRAVRASETRAAQVENDLRAATLRVSQLEMQLKDTQVNVGSARNAFHLDVTLHLV